MKTVCRWGIILALSVLFQELPAYSQVNRVRGDGHLKSENRNISGSFTRIRNAGIFHVFITQGARVSVRVEADENLMPYILTSLSGTSLNLGTPDNTHLSTSDPVNIYITLPELKSLQTSGSGSFESRNLLKVSDLDIGVSGEGKVNLDLEGNNIRTLVSGSGEIRLAGKGDRTSFTISGKADVKAYDLEAKICEIHISGIGDAEVNASSQLDVVISGLGNIRYKGNPRISQMISGMGKISGVQ